MKYFWYALVTAAAVCLAVAFIILLSILWLTNGPGV